MVSILLQLFSLFFARTRILESVCFSFSSAGEYSQASTDSRTLLTRTPRKSSIKRERELPPAKKGTVAAQVNNFHSETIELAIFPTSKEAALFSHRKSTVTLSWMRQMTFLFFCLQTMVAVEMSIDTVHGLREHVTLLRLDRFSVLSEAAGSASLKFSVHNAAAADHTCSRENSFVCLKLCRHAATETSQ